LAATRTGVQLAIAIGLGNSRPISCAASRY
jgi:hypothetical protein